MIEEETTTSDSKKTSILNIKSFELSDGMVLQRAGVCTRTGTGGRRASFLYILGRP